MKSVKNLLKLLEESGVIQPGWKLKRVLVFGDESPIKETVIEYKSNDVEISNETYGKRSMVYLRFKTQSVALFIWHYLNVNGYKPDSSWDNKNPTSYEIPVSYFKGKRWWE
jgi:hypothetical protein